MVYRKKVKKSLKELPKDTLPREKLLKFGIRALDEAELWAVILGSGTKGVNVLEIGKTLAGLNREELLKLSLDRLLQIPGLGKAKSMVVLSVVELCKRLSQRSEQPKIENPRQVVEIVSNLIKAKKEHLFVLTLSPNQKLINLELVAVGGLNILYASPREVLTPVLANGGYFYILVHNHPGGDAKPSAEDIAFTKKICEVGKLLDVEMLDHIILGEDGYFSFRENKLVVEC